MSELHLGIDVGGTKVLGVAIDPVDPAVPVAVHRADTPGEVGRLVEVLSETFAALRASAIDAGHQPGPMGLGVPGVVDRTGILRGAPNLPCAVDAPILELLEQRVGAPVTIENDANCALWAEARLGAGRGASDVVMVALGTGIGGAIMVGGELRVGSQGFAGEPGHMVVAAGGVHCPCGRRGCWERYASGAGLAWLAGEAASAGAAPRILELAGGDPAAIRGEHVTTAADQADPDALAVFDRFAEWLALGLGSLMNILDPDLVILGGGLASQSRHYLDRVQELLFGEVLGAGPHRRTSVVMAEFGPEAGAIGAALLAGSPSRRH